MIRRVVQGMAPRLAVAALGAALLAGTGCAQQMGRGSPRSLYTIAGVLEVFRQDLGKDAQMRLDQQLLFRLEKDPALDGHWSLVECSPGVLLVLSETPRVPPGEWGLLLQARALGRGEVKLRYTPAEEEQPPRDYLFEVSVAR